MLEDTSNDAEEVDQNYDAPVVEHNVGPRSNDLALLSFDSALDLLGTDNNCKEAHQIKNETWDCLLAYFWSFVQTRDHYGPRIARVCQ